ncbi:MAG: aldolase/citrate lyase family protein [Pseudomonadota bacterium]
MSFKQRLQSGESLSGTMVTLASPEVAEMLSLCDFDWLFLDGEHAPLAPLGWQRVIQATGGRCANLLRVPESTEAAMKQALDIGTDGVIVPNVKTADLAKQIVDWCKYPPRGSRGVGLARAHGYGLGFAEYVQSANDDTLVVIQAEHIDAVNNIEDIVKVNGIDCVFIGPYDLSASMGKMGEVDDPDVIAAIDHVAATCKSKNISLGYFGVDANAVRVYRDKGFSLICAGTDAGLLTGAAMQLRESLNS